MAQMSGPVAPKDPTVKKPYFYVMLDKDIFGSPQPDGRGIQFIYEDSGRLINSASFVGGVTDQEILDLMKTTEGFRKLVYSIGISLVSKDTDSVRFAFQMYGKEDPLATGTTLTCDLPTDGQEMEMVLEAQTWSDMDAQPGQIRFEFPKAEQKGLVSVRFYLNDGFSVPEVAADRKVDFASEGYKAMIGKCLMNPGELGPLSAVIEKARRGEEIVTAFIGGSVTQGAGAVPIHEKCYPRLFAQDFEKTYAQPGKVKLIKAGVGGTPSELGMLRFERDILRDGAVNPDLLVIEFAVNDEGDETKGKCYESLIRKAMALPEPPAIVLLFAVFATDYNLQERLGPVGFHYDLPMVSLKDAVTEQFYLTPGEGRIISKNQYFYDVFHPSNNGHRIMADCLLELCRAAESAEPVPADYERHLDMEPIIGGEFEDVVLIDRKTQPLEMEYSEGGFSGTDEDLQRVEMDDVLQPVPEFPYNWQYDGSNHEPFRVRLRCKAFFVINKDSGSPEYGKIACKVDGRLVRVIDPLANGWTHCNPMLLLNEAESAVHEIEIGMDAGDEGKKATILGFGAVK